MRTSLLPPSSRHPVLRYGIAFAALGAAMLLIILIPGMREGAFILLAAAAVFGAWYSGIRTGMFALLFGTLAIITLFLLPNGLPLNLNYFVRFVTYTALVIFVMLVLHNREAATARLAEERERLQIANQSFLALGEAAPLGIVVYERDGRVRSWGPAAERITGFTAEDSIGNLPLSIPPDRLDEFHQMLETTASRRSVYTMESVRKRKDGRLIDVSVSSSPLYDPQGKVTGFVTIFDDITTAKRAQVALQYSEQHLRKVLDSLFAYVWVLTPDGTLIEVNRAALETANLRAEDVLGKPYWDTYWWAWSTGVQDRVRAAIQEGARGAASRFDTEIRIADERHVLIDFMLSPMLDEQGRVTHLVPSAIDVTERKNEERLNAQLQFITAALSVANTPQAVAEAVSMRVKLALGAHLATVVSTIDETQEVEILDTTGLPDNLKTLFQRMPLNYPGALNQCIIRNEPIYAETQDEYVAQFPEVAHIIRDETRSHATACLPIRAGERVLGGLGVSFGVPRKLNTQERMFLHRVVDAAGLALERARLYEAEAEARRVAERANLLKTRFLAIVSHELRTPLTSIKGFATTLLQEDITWDAISQRDFLQIIDAESDKLAEMVDHLLDFSRIEAGTLRIARQSISVDSILEFVLPQVHVLTEKHDLQINFPPDLPPIDADHRRIGQVITNIIVNAVRYSPPGGVILVEASVEQGHVRFDITDNGPGIPADERDAVFEAFHQAQNRPAGEMKGAGLGLAIAKGIIQAHEGKIWVDDRDAPGTTISFILPVDLRVDEGEAG